MTLLVIAALLAIMGGMYYLGHGVASDCDRCLLNAAVLITGGTIAVGLVTWAL